MFPGEEVGGGGFDGGEVGEVEVEEFQAAVGGGVEFLEFLDGELGFVPRAAGDIDGAVLLVEDLAELFADAGVASCYDEDAASLVRKVLFGEGWLWDEDCLLYTSPSPRDGLLSRMPSSA